eukprot:1248476-Rhodomonas_salina.1
MRADASCWISQGVQLKTEADGRMFPVTDDSQTIVDALCRAADAAGVTVRCDGMRRGRVWERTGKGRKEGGREEEEREGRERERERKGCLLYTSPSPRDRG